MCAVASQCQDIEKSWDGGDNALQLVYKLVILGKLTYAATAWWGYTTANGGKHHLEAFVHCAGLCPVDGPNMQQLVTDSDDASFGQILGKQHHMLRELLPNTTNDQYGFRNRRHNYTLNTRTATDE